MRFFAIALNDKTVTSALGIEALLKLFFAFSKKATAESPTLVVTPKLF